MRTSPLRIAVLANLKRNAGDQPSLPPDAWAELDADETIQAVTACLERAGHTATFFEGDLSLIETLPRFRPDLCLNLCEGHFGDSRESHIPALLEMLRIPYTGSGVLALALTLDKPLTKQVLIARGLPTPPAQLFERGDEPLAADLVFPLFVKPAHEGSGMGVSADSVVHDPAELRRQVAWVLATYRQPALAEHYIRGPEITIGLLGNSGSPRLAGQSEPWAQLPWLDGVHVLPPYELLAGQFPASAGQVYTGQMKSGWQGHWVEGQHYRCPAALSPAQRQEVLRLAVATFRATGCRDIARVDLRLDANDGHRPYILEINALPGLAPGWSDMVFEAAAAGLSYDELILAIVHHGAQRLGLLSGPRPGAAESAAGNR